MKQEYMIHVAGPDDIFGPNTEIEALRIANEVNETFVEICSTQGIENTPMCVATVKLMEDK